ncbi:MAG: CysB family HTH-type transcriptional regulator [Rhodocyclales bacterium]|nr:CysB family HTH-type transcriptional regulator [Rhodocyclales bacterium]
MKLQQLKYLVEVERRGLNVSEAAAALFTSQPGISKQVRLLETELGVIVFERSGKRLTGITAAGRVVLDLARKVLAEAANLARASADFAAEGKGQLMLATTHTQARYTLPPVIRNFVGRYPDVRLHVHQGSPGQVAEWLLDGTAEIGIATEALDRHPELLTLPCYQWSHKVVVPKGHPLSQVEALTLAALAQYPLITYDASFTGRSHIDRAFERQGLAANVVLSAIDADVIKTYVELGLGVGIIAEMAFDPQRDGALAALAANHLFDTNTTRLAFRGDLWLRGYDFEFIELLAPQLTRRVVEATIRGGDIDPGL